MISRTGLRSKLSLSHIEDALRSEIGIMASLDHPYIVKLKEALEDETSKKIYLVMEYCSKGCILSNTYWNATIMSKNNFLEEESCEHNNDSQRKLTLFQAKRYFIQILQGLDYCRTA